MGKWLEALRRPEKRSGKATNTDLQNHQNPSEEGFEGFDGSPPEPFQNFQAWDAADWQFAIEERAAILEFDEGMSRLEADALAADQIAAQRRWQLQ
jgi:hypothetical protein